MASLRKDTGAGRAAIARRRQRVASASVSSEQSRSVLSEPRVEATNNRETPAAYGGSSNSPYPTPHAAVEVRRSETPAAGHDRLLERSHQVANEAASVLASVRKSKAVSTSRSTLTPAGNADQARQALMYQQEKQEGVPLQQSRTEARIRPEVKSRIPPASQKSAPKDKEEAVVVEKTIEDLEPLVFDTNMDASCLPWSSNIRIRSNGAPNQMTLKAVEKSIEEDEQGPKAYALQADAIGLGSEHVLRLLPVNSVPRRPVLCYGDSVILRSNIANDHTLAVTAVIKEGGGNNVENFELGFLASTVARAGQWTVIRATIGDERVPVRVGHLAIEKEESPKGPTAPVRSGDAIVLRNRKTGGLLALIQGQLTLVTDSYDSSVVRNGSTLDPSLMGRLQRHELLVPAAAETFHLLLSSVPPTPLWVSARGAKERVFLNGSYLLDAERNQIDPTLERVLFGAPTSRLGVALDHSEYMGTIRAQQLQTPKGQEDMLLDEVLGSFLGLEGKFIRSKLRSNVLKEVDMDDVEFQLVDPPEFVFNVSLRSLVEEMLPVATDFARVRHFVSSHFPGYEYGNVMQSFCETLDRLLQDYVVYVAGLEQQYRQSATVNTKPAFSMRELQVLMQPSLHVMAVLKRAIEATRNKKGGALINALRALQVQCYNGDAAAGHVLGVLLDNASLPYMHILKNWLECGVLSDPSSEFMIEFSDTATWDERYTLKTDHVLEGFFSNKVAVERVLATGRFWNALQACHEKAPEVVKDSDQPAAAAVILRYTTNAARVSAFVQTMYHRASRSLVRLLLHDYNLVGSLRLMKRYFLLDQGDFFVNFLDAAEAELLKELPNVSRGRIQHWLSVSVQLTENHGEEGPAASSSQAERMLARQLNPSKLRCRFASESLMDHLDRLHAATGGIDTNEPPTPLRHAYGGMMSEGLTGLDAFSIEFPVIPFPVSLVLSQSAMSSYQLLFRNLFFAKHVERRLVGIWQDHQAMKELQSLRGSLGPTFLLRQRMLHFLQNLIYYMMFEVIEPNWLEMEASIASPSGQKEQTVDEASIASPSGQKEQTVDDILHVHNQFLHHTLEACLLTNRDLVRALTKLMTTCLLFSDQMKRFMKATKIDEDRETVALEKQKVIQRNLNDRGGSRVAVSRKLLQHSMQNDRVEKQRRVQKQSARVEREVTSDSFRKMMARFDEVFSDNLREFMLQLTESDDLYHTHKMNLCIRLDYNGFVGAPRGESPRTGGLERSTA